MALVLITVLLLFLGALALAQGRLRQAAGPAPFFVRWIAVTSRTAMPCIHSPLPERRWTGPD